MLNEQLKRKRVKSIMIDNIEYFDVQDIKNNHPDLKVDVNKIMYVNEIALIKADDVHAKTEFDKMIKQVFPNKD